jgi:hypothetical protein
MLAGVWKREKKKSRRTAESNTNVDAIELVRPDLAFLF